MPTPNILSQGRNALIARLGNIEPGNDYRTDAGSNVQSGWFNEVINASTCAYPLIVVQKGKDNAPNHSANGMRKLSGYLVIGAVNAGLDGYEDALDDLEMDILECLMPLEGVPVDWMPRGIPRVTLGASQQVPPGDGLAAATVFIPVYLHSFVQAHSE